MLNCGDIFSDTILLPRRIPMLSVNKSQDRCNSADKRHNNSRYASDSSELFISLVMDGIPNLTRHNVAK